MTANKPLARLAWSAIALTLLAAAAPGLAAEPRHGTITALEPIENKGDDVPEKTKRFANLGAALGSTASSILGIKSEASPMVQNVAKTAGTEAGRSAGAKIAGNGDAAHYMVKIRFDNKSQVVVPKASSEIHGLAVGSRVTVTGSGENMQIAAE